MSELFIKDEYLKMLCDIFSQYCPHAEVWAYGSRLNGNAHEGSDLDLVVKSFNEANKNINELKELIRESNIPFLVDINLYTSLPQSFQEEINKKYIKIFI